MNVTDFPNISEYSVIPSFKSVTWQTYLNLFLIIQVKVSSSFKFAFETMFIFFSVEEVPHKKYRNFIPIIHLGSEVLFPQHKLY